jgi:AraC family transcriptional regulator of arabinose operon
MEDPDPPLTYLHAGYFWQDSRYRTFRSKGTTSWLAMLTLSGCGRMQSTKESLDLPPNSLALIRPGTLHDYGTKPGHEHWELLWAHFHPWPHWIWLLRHSEIDPGVAILRLNDFQVSKAEKSIREALSPVGNGWLKDYRMMNAIERMLMIVQPENERLPAERLRPILERLAKDHHQVQSLSDLAQVAGLSVSQFSRLFRSETGQTPRAYIEGLRIDHAKQLLQHTSLSIQAIAERTGFPNVFYFSNRFRKATGKSPSDYRRRVDIGSNS